MKKAARIRFWLEIALATITGLLSVITLFWNDWIELVFRVDPDSGNGTLEQLIVGILFAVTVVLFAMARIEWHHIRLAHAE